KLGEIGSAVVFSQQKTVETRDRFLSGVIKELKRIDLEPHAALRRLSILRERIRVEDEFRHRSGQSVARTPRQSILMTVPYFALAVFVGMKFGLRGNEKFFLQSSALITSGAIWIWFGGRTLKWKV